MLISRGLMSHQGRYNVKETKAKQHEVGRYHGKSDDNIDVIVIIIYKLHIYVLRILP